MSSSRSPMTRGGHSLFSFRSGENSSEPGAESVATLETDGQFVNENGVLRLELTLTSSYAEFATGGNCQQRAQSETVRDRVTLLCAPGAECATLRRAREVTEPGYDTNCRGRRTARAAETDVYEVAIRVPDPATIRVTLVSGTPPEGTVGDHPVGDLGLSFGSNGEEIGY